METRNSSKAARSAKILPIEGCRVVDNGNNTYTVEEGFAAIGENKYGTLADAIDAANSGDTIKLLADITIEGNAGLTISANKNFTLDLNGYTLKNSVNENKGSQVILNKGTLVIKDSSANGTGKITNEAEGVIVGEWWSDPRANYATNVITNQGTLTLESGKIIQTAAGSICYAIDSGSSRNNVTLEIKGGTVENGYRTAIRIYTNATYTNTVNVSGGVVNAGARALYVQLPGTANYKANVTITGGTFTATADNGYAFYDYSDVYGPNKTTSDENNYNNITYSISDGRFNGLVVSQKVENFITGGTFSNDPSSVNPNDYDNDWDHNATLNYVAGGYTAVENDGVYTVEEVKG